MSKMASAQSLTFSIASFVTALFPLELGADKFIDHTAIFAHRIGVPQTIVALLTAGGEWEEVSPILVARPYHFLLWRWLKHGVSTSWLSSFPLSGTAGPPWHWVT